MTKIFPFNSEAVLQFEAFIPISYPVPYPRCCLVVDGPGYLARYLTRYPTRYVTPCLVIFWYMDKALEWRNLFGPKDKVSYHEKLVFEYDVRFLFLFVIMDAILLKVDLQKRTSVLSKPPNGSCLSNKNASYIKKLGGYFWFLI